MKRVVVGRDAWLIYVAGFMRSITVGLIGVILAIYFVEEGLSVAVGGLIIGVGIAGAALATILVSVVADRLGRRRTLATVSVLTAVGCVGVAVTSQIGVLAVLAFLGLLNGMGRDRGPATALEQALLPETTTGEGRTWVLAGYNLVLDIGHATGALVAVVPGLLSTSLHLPVITSHQLTFVLCGCAVASTSALYLSMSPHVEAAKTAPQLPSNASDSDRRTKRAVHTLALLFGIDSLGGGFLGSALIGYWFFKRYGVSEGELAALFFCARVLNAASHLGAAWLAARIGLLNTMVLTHLPSSVFLLVVPAAPTAWMAAALFLAREALVEMDVPTRQSYVLAIVEPHRRTYASGVTNVARMVAWAIGPAVAGIVMQQVNLAGPLIIGASVKIVYDVVLYRSFRNITPRETRSPAIGT